MSGTPGLPLCQHFMPVCVPAREAQKVQGGEKPQHAHHGGATGLGLWSRPRPAVDLGTHFASPDLGLLVCKVRGRGRLLSRVFFHLKSSSLWLLPLLHQQSEVC